MENKIFFLFFAIFLVLPLCAFGAGLGVAPAVLSFDNALKGTTTEKQIVVQNPGDTAILVSLSIDGEMKEWIELEKSSGVEVAAKGETKIVLRLNPPEDAENGEYTSKLKVISTAAAGVEGSGMGLFPGINIDIVATITDKEIVSGEVSKILTKDEEYGTPVKFNIGFTNTGNIPIGPSVKIEIEKRGSGVIDNIDKNLEAIKPGESKDYEVKWDTNGKEIGVYYRAKVAVYLDDKLIEGKENVGFRVLEKIISEKEGPKVWVGALIVAIILILGFTIFYFITRK